jgi:negative regulator of sigma-B (phosphoserine phosphatase)
VGDVAGVLIPPAGGVPRRHLACHGGVVGKNLPPLHATVLPLGHRDLVILATDGVEAGFADEIFSQDPCDRIADGILKRFARGTDDALVLVARYLGGVSGRR